MKIQTNTLSRHCLGTIKTLNINKLLTGKECLNAVRTILTKHETVELGSQQYNFPNNSFTITVCLQESHVSIHTWPEKNIVQLDVFLCNYISDNTQKCENIYNDIVAYFEAYEDNRTVLERL